MLLKMTYYSIVFCFDTESRVPPISATGSQQKKKEVGILAETLTEKHLEG